jgi:multidrug resistance efflux pump
VQQYLKEKKSNYKFSFYTFLFFIISLLIVSFLLQTFLTLSHESKSNIYPVKMINEQFVVKGIGVLEARREVIIPISEDGQVIDVFVRPGQVVKESDVLANIVNYELVEGSQKVEYEISDIESDVNNKRSELQFEKIKLQSSLARSSTAVKQNKLELSANKSLVEQGIISRINYEQSLMTFEQLKFDETLASKHLELFSATFDNQMNAIESKLKSSRKRLAYIMRRIESLTIKAPFAGIVSEVKANVGQTFNRGQSLFKIIEPNSFIAKVLIPQYSSSFISINQEATIKTPNGDVAAVVEHVDSIVRNGAVGVYLKLEETPKWLKVDQSIEASIITTQTVKRLFISTPSYFTNDQQWQLYKVNTQKNQAIKKSSTFEVEDSGVIYLTSAGLNDKDFVLLLPKNSSSEDVIDID